ncbi:ABC transporter substrate-binding protein [Luethyella okanaganae]|uniref:ABC transporter substrate-binding protein n=1 Tax=Luethyella okanaganae TaxID=69372 RepID=A0ABW1VJ99_9MICO
MHNHISWRKRGLTIAAALATAVALAGCTGGGAGPKPSGGNGEAVQGGELTIMSAGGVPSWDPLFTFGTLPGVITDRLIAVYGQLLYVDQTGTAIPSMAKSFTTENGGATWTVAIRDGITFTDGTPYDAAAVKFNWDRAADPANTASMMALAQSFTSEVADELTLTLTSPIPNPVLDLQIAEQLQLIASPTALQAGDYTKPVGAGPFVLVKEDKQVGEDLARNADYFEQGKPYLDTLKYRSIGDPSQRVETIASGGAQLMNGFHSDFRDYENDDRFAFFEVENGGFRHFAFNNTRAPFDDARARKAISLAVNPEELVQALLADPTQLGSTTLFNDGSPYYEASLGLPKQNLQEAQRLVDELVADGVDMNIVVVPAAIPELIRAAEYMQLSLQQLKGVTVTIEQIQIQDWRLRTQSNDDFDITFYPGIYDVNPAPTTMTNIFQTGGADNFQNSSSPEMDAALAELRAATDEAGRTAAVTKVQKYFVDEVPISVFGYDNRVFFHQANVGGFVAIGRGAILPQELHYTE